jgi:hypothetical protein
MLRYFIFSLFGPLIGLLITGIVLQPPVANNGRHLIALVVIGFLPGLVPALLTALADEALERRHGALRYALVTLIGAAVTLGICSLSKHRVPYFSSVATVAFGMSAAFCCWLHQWLRRWRVET